jgi:hypothetical protein
MGVFEDKKFDNLDWISQATEPIDSIMNEQLALMPDEVTLDFDSYRKIVSNSWSPNLRLEDVVSFFLRGNSIYKSRSWEEREKFIACFKLESVPEICPVSGIESPLWLDFEKKEISGGKVIFKKIKFTLDIKDLEALLGREGIDVFWSLNLEGAGSTARANEIMDLLGGCENATNSKSIRVKKHAIFNRLHVLFKTNEWNIRDTELANKVGRWLGEYIKSGNLAALSNFCRLKVMTHKGQPIYSMEEVK